MHDELTELLDDLGPDPECHCETVRKGIVEPCGKPAVGVFYGSYDGFYPVCGYHLHQHHGYGFPVELGTIISAARDTGRLGNRID